MNSTLIILLCAILVLVAIILPLAWVIGVSNELSKNNYLRGIDAQGRNKVQEPHDEH